VSVHSICRDQSRVPVRLSVTKATLGPRLLNIILILAATMRLLLAIWGHLIPRCRCQLVTGKVANGMEILVLTTTVIISNFTMTEKQVSAMTLMMGGR